MATPIDRSGSLLYDQDCGICVATAGWLADHAVPDRLGLLAVEQVGRDPRIEALVRGRNLMARVHFVRQDGIVLTGAQAILAAGRLVPGWRFVAMLYDHPLGHWLLEPLYDQVATHRSRIGRALGLPAACALPPRTLAPRTLGRG
jgi:predicted DCC family thiol-disulfide oxidoreductase YuxK